LTSYSSAIVAGTLAVPDSYTGPEFSV
jgi:hypothetical protein